MSEQFNDNTAVLSNEMYGKIIVIKRTGEDSASFELIDDSYTFGRAAECDIRIQLTSIADMHVKITRNEHGQAVLIKSNEECSVNINNMSMKESSRILEHNDIITLVERSFRYQYTPEMLARAQLANNNTSSSSGTISMSTETPKKPSSLSASVFSISELPSSPSTPKTPVPAARSNSISSNQSPMVSSVVDNEITTSPKMSPKVFKIETDSLSVVAPFNIVGASSLGTSVVSSTDEHRECDKENVEQVKLVLKVEKPEDVVDSVAVVEAESEDVCDSVTEVETGTDVFFDSVTEAEAEAVTEVETEPYVFETVTNDNITEAEAVCEPVENVTEIISETVTEVVPEAVNDKNTESEEICEAITEPSDENSTEPSTEIDCVVDSYEASRECTEVEVADNEQVSESIDNLAESSENVVCESITKCSVDYEREDVTMETSETPADTVEVVDGIIVPDETADDSVIETFSESKDVQMSESSAEVCDSTESMVCEQVVEAAVTKESDSNVMECEETTEITYEDTAQVVTELSNGCNTGVINEVVTSDEASEMMDSTAPVESEIMTVEPVVNLMEGVEEIEEIVEQQSEEIEGPKSTDPISISEEVQEDVPESVESEISGDNMEAMCTVDTIDATNTMDNMDNMDNMGAMDIMDSEPSETVESTETVELVNTEAVELETEETVATEESCEPNAIAEPTTDETIPLFESTETVVSEHCAEVIQSPVIEEVASTTENSNEQEVEESVPIVELPEEDTVEHVDAMKDISSTENVAVELEVLGESESEEIASVEIEMTVRVTSPKRTESDAEAEAPSTPAPLRKSTRVHVTPAALESVKKNQTSPQSKQRTSGRATRSRVTDTPASPKNRVQKRQKSESDDVDDENEKNENVELYGNNNHTEKRTKINSNTPVRRSTRSRVNQK